MKPRSGRLALLFAIAIIGCAVLVMRTGMLGGKSTNYANGPQRPRRERLDTAALPHTTPAKLSGRTYIRRNIPVLGIAHTVFTDDATGHLQIVASKQLMTDGRYDIKLADDMRTAFAGILIELPGHGFAFLDRDTCKQPDLDIQLVFTTVPEVKPDDGGLALMVDDIFPLDVTALFSKWTPVLQKRLGALPGTSFLRTTRDKKGCFFLSGRSKALALRKISGQVTDRQGRPITTTIALWMGMRQSGPGLLSVSTSRDGKFTCYVDSEAIASVGVWDPTHRWISEPKYIDSGTVSLIAKPAGLADVIVNEGGSGEPVQGLVFGAERQDNASNEKRTSETSTVYEGSRMTGPSGHARILLPVGSYIFRAAETTTKGGMRWEVPERKVMIKAAGPAPRIHLRATRMRTRTLTSAHGVEPK